MNGKPILFYAINTFQNSDIIDEIILVTGIGEQQYAIDEIVKKYHFTKVHHVIEGGKERYHSVYNGLKCINDYTDSQINCFIHDGARPFVSDNIIKRAFQAVMLYKACAVGMPVKDTIKIADGDKFASFTPNRNDVWMIQTPQVFSYSIIVECYEKLMMELEKDSKFEVTDDASVVELFSDYKVKLVEGSYENIKITTPEDMNIAKSLCK